MEIKALAFDVFGTLVDWRSAILREMTALSTDRGVAADWAAFTDDWKSTYRGDMDAVNSGQRPWTNVDVFFRRRLDDLLPVYGLDGLNEAERDHLNRVWTRPDAWPDVASALRRLRRHHVLSTLSNGNFAWLVAIARHCGYQFDCVLTAENAKAYKPDAAVYHMAIELLGEAPENILMVACHNYDLTEARKHGMRTAFIPRWEHGPNQTKDRQAEQDWDFVVDDLGELAEALEP